MTVTSGMVRCQADRFLLSVCCAKSAVGRHAAKAKNRYSLFILPPFLFPTKCTGDNPDIKFIYQFPFGRVAVNHTPSTGYFTRKYYNPQAPGDQNSGMNIITMRYADILLMYAEAVHETSGMTEEVWNKTIRPIRERAGFTADAALNFPAGKSKEEMRQIIRDERRVEMAMEGLRWYDIKRWKAGNEYLSGKVRGASFVDENKLDTRKFEEARDYLWAVPISEINLNPNLAPNNPGYGN